MRSLWLGILCLFLSVPESLPSISPDLSISFEKLCGKESKTSRKIWSKLTSSDHELISRYGALFRRQIAKIHKPFTGSCIGSSIPRVIHFIWIGPNSFPIESIENVKSFRELHPDWEIHFWTDSSTRPLPIPSCIRRLISDFDLGPLSQFLNRTQNYGEKSDLIRYMILLREGGVYVDHDVHCFASFENIHSSYDYYGFIENLHYFDALNCSVLAGNCVIGAKPNHPILEQTVREIIACWDRVENENRGNDQAKINRRVMHRTFASYARSVQKLVGMTNCEDMLFPPTALFSQRVFNGTARAKLTQRGWVFAHHNFRATWVRKNRLKQSK